MSTLPEIATELVRPVFYLLLPESRFFWLYLLSAIVIALAVCYARQPADAGRSLRRAWLAVFPRQVFLHPSALLDYRFVAINHILHVLILGGVIANTVTVTEGALALLRLVLGDSGGGAEAGPLASLAFTVCTLVAFDGGLFVAHWLQHKLPVLWEFHKVHHSAEVLTPITVLRMHPVDIVLNALTTALLLGAANGVFLYLYAGAVAEMTVIGANVLSFLFFLGGYHLRHSHVWILFPRGLREHISSPALHHIHHSKDPRHYDKNFARVFTLWDRLAGTLYIPEGKEELAFGLDDRDQRELRTVGQLYLSPFRRLIRRYRRRRRGAAGGAARI
jgi:sterol desaturase/sphingolipid hydroxylase (fatty acid hydroxylase superfamily)